MTAWIDIRNGDSDGAVVYATAWTRGGRTLVLATHTHCRLAVADLETARLVRLLQLPSSSYHSYDMSYDGSRLITGYDGPRYIDLWSVERGSRIGHFKKAEAARVRFDATAAYVLTWVMWKGYVVSFATNTWTRISRIADLDGAFLDIESNTMYVPVYDSSHLYRIRFDPVEIEKVGLAHSSPLFTIRKSPVNSIFIFLYEDGRVECREGLFGSLIWSRQFVDKEITASGSYSGDGRFYGLNVVNLEQYWVLDAATGAVVHKRAKVKQGVDPRSPLRGSLILNSSGTILDAETGEVQPGVSSLEWWTQAGMPLPPPL